MIDVPAGICLDPNCTSAPCKKFQAQKKEIEANGEIPPGCCLDPNCLDEKCKAFQVERLKKKEAAELAKGEDAETRRQEPIVMYRLYMFNPHNNNTFLLDHDYNILHTERDLRRNEHNLQRSPSPAGCILRPQRIEFWYNTIDDLREKIPELDIRDYY